jgi:outer membrane receptor for monomeric catechols
MSWRPIDPFSMEVAYTDSNFKYTKTDTLAVDGAWLPNSPEHQLTVDLDYDVLPGLTLGVGTEVQTKWFLNSKNTATLDEDGNVVAESTVNGFTRWNARLTYAWKVAGLQGDLMVSGLNLFDRKYIAFTEPDPDGNSYHPAPTREVFVSARFRFGPAASL